MSRSITVCTALLLLSVGTSSALAGVDDLLFVVANSGALTSGESTRKTWFESNGYTVTLISDSAAQTSFDSAAAVNNVAWISPDVVSTTLSTKLKFKSIGVVNEVWDLADDFGFSGPTEEMVSRNYIEINNNTHYITYGQTIGDVVILSSSQTFARRTDPLSAGAVNLADIEDSFFNDYPGLLTLDNGAALYGGGNATGRRVQIPTGSTGFNFSAINSTGHTIYRRAIEWAARPNPSLGGILLPVQNTASLTAQEKLKQMQLDVWGYDVTLIDDDATQATYTAAFSGKLAVYLPKDASAASISTKLTNCPIGVVSES